MIRSGIAIHSFFAEKGKATLLKYSEDMTWEIKKNIRL